MLFQTVEASLYSVFALIRDSVKDYYGRVVLVGINYDKDTKEHQCKIEFIDK